MPRIYFLHGSWHGAETLLSHLSLLLSRPVSFNQYSSRTNANKHLRIHHHLRVLVSRGLYKAFTLLYFTYMKHMRKCILQEHTMHGAEKLGVEM